MTRPHSAFYSDINALGDFKRGVNVRRVFTQILSLAACQSHVDRVFREQGRSGPAVKDGRGCASASFCTDEYSISLPRRYRTLPIVLHEAAHGLLACGPDIMRFRTGVIVRGPMPRTRALDPADRRVAWSAHGPIFVAIHIALIAAHGIANAEPLRRSAIDCRLDVARFEPEDRRAAARPVPRRRSSAGWG
jgi:hypothetical protein